MWKMGCLLIKQGISRGIRKYLSLSQNDSTIYQNLWGSYKTVLRGKLIALQLFPMAKEKPQQDSKKGKYVLRL